MTTNVRIEDNIIRNIRGHLKHANLLHLKSNK